MLPQFIAIPNSPHDLTTDTRSSRNKNRNLKPSVNCSASKVRCNVSHPYTKHLYKRCKEDGLTECPPYVQRDVRKRRAPYRKRNPASPTERTDTSELVFIYENMSTSNNTEVSRVGSSEVGNVEQQNADLSSQMAPVQSVGNIQYSVARGYGDAIPDVQQANDFESVSGNIASTSAAPANGFEGLNSKAIHNNITAEENQLFSYNWLDLLNREANYQL